MFPALLLGACTFPGNDEAPLPLAPATAGPTGDGLPVNVAPWVLIPVRRAAPGVTSPPRPASYREIKLVDRRGKEVPTRRTQEEMPAATWVRLHPRAPLAPGVEYRLVVPGSVMVSLSTGAEADLAPPGGGELRAWTWEATPDCPTITLRTAPVGETSGLTWEVDLVDLADPGAHLRVLGVEDSADLQEGPLVRLRDCGTGNALIPRAGVDLRIRWVDAAGNASPWSGPVRIPTALTYAGELVTAPAPAR